MKFPLIVWWNKTNVPSPFRTSLPKRQTDLWVREQEEWASLFCGGRQHHLLATLDQLQDCDEHKKEDFESRPNRAGNFSLLFRRNHSNKSNSRVVRWTSVTARSVEDIPPHSTWKNTTEAMKHWSRKLPFATPLDGRCEWSWASTAQQSQQGNIGTSLSWKSHSEWTTEMTERWMLQGQFFYGFFL